MHTRKRLSFLWLLLGLSLVFPANAQPGHENLAARPTLYRGGHIITMDEKNPQVEALVVEAGRIVAVGGEAELAGKYTDAVRVDLGDKTMLPGFIDGHSHFFQAAMIADYANISAPPVGEAADIPSLLEVLRKHASEKPLQKGDWLVGYGYDGTALAEGRELTRDDLDKDFPDNPVALIHVSGHGVVLNSAAFQAVGVDANTKTPEGGVIVRKEGSNEPAGLMMETAWLAVFPKLPKPGDAELLHNLKAAQDHYASNGYTTVQDAPIEPKVLPLYRKAQKENRFFLDLVGYAEQHMFPSMIKEGAFSSTYDNHFRIAGVKVILDGSPQGKTAYFSEPFLTGGPGGEENYRGEFITPQEELNEIMKLAYANNLQVLAHANGDGAIDMFLTGHRAAGAPMGRRSTTIHSQFIRPDQIDDYAEMGLLASFFTNHAFFWGDVHVENLGKERAFFLSPLKTAREKGLRMTNHSDFLVTPLDPMFILWTAVNRVSRSGQVIGPDERVTPIEGLKALTIDGAYQYFEEESKGSLEPGKVADMVILDQNPLTVDPMKIKDIKIVETIKEGKSVYRRS